MASHFDSTLEEIGSTVRVELPDSMRAPLELAAEQAGRRRPYGLSLFWRTFLLLIALLVGSAIGWYQLFQRLEYQPRIINNARQVTSLVNLTRAALMHTDSIERTSLIKTLVEQEKVRILTREPGDQFEPLAGNDLERRVSDELIARLGPNTLVAGSVNGQSGLWVSFSIQDDAYWLQMERSRIRALWGNGAWLLGLTMLVALSLIGAVVLARLINRPLQQLLNATAHVRHGNYEERLDESTRASEIRQVNIGFNRMAEQISRVERDRTEMLAGISHDLRTPLARLRLETEMSVPDSETRELMAADIAQVDAVIEKFLDYARPGRAAPQPLRLAELARACAQPFIAHGGMQVQIDIPPGLRVLGDAIDFRRVLANLLENAQRYGRTPGTVLTRVRIVAREHGHMITLRVRDYGPGVPPELLANLARPFYRGDRARTAASSTGLGLAIVAKVVHNMGGQLEFGNSSSGGLIVLIRLPQMTEQQPDKEPPRGAQ